MNIAELRRLEVKRPWDINDIDAMRNALPELLKALEEAREALEEAKPYVARYESDNFSNSALNTYTKIEAALRVLPPHGGVDVG